MKRTKTFYSKHYFIPPPSKWPITSTCSLFLMLVGVINIIHNNWYGHYLLAFGVILFIFMLYGWFNTIINESMQGLYNKQLDQSYRWGMIWFIASEASFFSIFFGALFYARLFAVPTLGGLQHGQETHALLWPQFEAIWPLLKNPNPTLFVGPKGIIGTWGIPAFNTLLLLSSALAVTWAHWGLEKNQRWRVNIGLLITILLGATFLSLQAFEYYEAYTHLGLTLKSGIYGTTFFMLTGFHALHVSVGLLMLIVIFIRCLNGHFSSKHSFGFKAVAWYWHFVDVIWLFLFVFVYWL